MSKTTLKIEMYLLFIFVLSMIISFCSIFSEGASLVEFKIFLGSTFFFIVILFSIINEKNKEKEKEEYEKVTNITGFLFNLLVVSFIVFTPAVLSLSELTPILKPLAYNQLAKEYQDLLFFEDMNYNELMFGDNTVNNISFKILPSSDSERIIKYKTDMIMENILIHIKNNNGKVCITGIEYEVNPELSWSKN